MNPRQETRFTRKSGSEREASLNASKVGEGRRVKDEVKKIHWADSSAKSVETDNSQKAEDGHKQ
jgi:hypothetical protein